MNLNNRKQPEATISKKKRKKLKTGANGEAATLSRAKVRDYESHVLVCQGGDCKKRGAKETRKAIKNGLRAAGMNGDVRMDCVDCLGLCKHGPNVVVYPSGTWYLGLDEDRVPEVVEQHLRDGEPVEDLAAEFRKKKPSK